MKMHETEAWVLHREEETDKKSRKPAQLIKERYSFPDINEREVLAEPIYGCWEGNMTHAIERKPMDICAIRGEEKVVIGNAGVVRVLEVGESVKQYKPGDYCMVFPIANWDKHGFGSKAFGFEAPNTIGVLAKKMKLHEMQLIPVPKNTGYPLRQWAGFSLRFITAWSNWKLAYGCYRLQLSEADCPEPFVVAWGGGVSLAQLLLAKYDGCRVAMITSRDDRIEQIREMGIEPIDRRDFGDLQFDGKRYATDQEYKKKYIQSEKIFFKKLEEIGEGREVAIFLEHIGAPVYRATLKALGREGILATVGWKEGMKTTSLRGIECHKRRQHINSSYARHSEGFAAIAYGENTGWMPPYEEKIYSWDEIPKLANEYANGEISSYFPVFRINTI